jgi:hypothetical protein
MQASGVSRLGCTSTTHRVGIAPATTSQIGRDHRSNVVVAQQFLEIGDGGASPSRSSTRGAVDPRFAVGVTEGTIKIHLHNIYGNLDVPNRTSLTALAITYH